MEAGQGITLVSLPAGRRQGEGAPRALGITITYGVLGAVLAAYVVMLVVFRNSSESSFLNNWAIDGFEVVVALLCIARAFIGGPLRPVAITLGAGLLAWSLGDVLWSAETLGGGNPTTPSPADLFYLLFYPLACVAIILLMRVEVRKQPLTAWLDGIMTGLGAAAVVAAFAFDTIAGRERASADRHHAFRVSDRGPDSARHGGRRPGNAPVMAECNVADTRPRLCTRGGR